MATAAYLFLAPFPASAGWRAFALFLALLALIVPVVRGRAALRPHRIPRPMAIAGACWIALSVASLAWSDNPRYSWQEIQRELMYSTLAFTVFLYGTRDDRDLRRGIKAALVAALLLGFFEWVRFIFPGVPLGNKYQAAQGSFSTLLVLVAPLLVIVAWRAPDGMGTAPRTVAILGAAIVVVGFAAENRMLWIALMVDLIAAYVMYRRSAGAKAGARLRRALVTSLAAVALLLGATSAYKTLLYYPQADSPVDSLAFDARPMVWASALPPLVERPWFGHGFGREIVGPVIERGVLQRGGASIPIHHAHNVFFDVLLQSGIAGCALFMALLASLALAFVRLSARRDTLPLAIAGIAMIAGFIVKNMTDDFYYRPSSLVFWALSGLLLGAARARTDDPA